MRRSSHLGRGAGHCQWAATYYWPSSETLTFYWKCLLKKVIMVVAGGQSPRMSDAGASSDLVFPGIFAKGTRLALGRKGSLWHLTSEPWGNCICTAGHLP